MSLGLKSNVDGSAAIMTNGVDRIVISPTGAVTLPTTTQLGVGQAYQVFNTGRALGGTYTNSTGAPIYVSVSAYASAPSQGLVATVAGVAITLGYTQSNGTGGVFRGASGSFIVPAGATYSVNVSGGVLDSWSELR